MTGMLSQLSKCLWCIWPVVVGFIGLYFWRAAGTKTHFGSLTVGIDPLKPEGQKEFETTRQRDKDKKKILYWCGGIIAAGYLIALVATSAPIKALAAQDTKTPTITTTASPTWTLAPSRTRSMITMTPEFTPTYAPTATDRIVYRDHTVNVPGPVQVVTVVVLMQVPVVITQVVTVEVTRIVTATFTPTPTATPTETPTETWTPTATETP